MPACPALPADHPAHVLRAATPEETDAIGRALAAALVPGDVVALHGPLGAGKSHLARAVIRARLADPRAEVPSPSYTLVNIYGTDRGEIWHADLYRVDPDELVEIGLAGAPRDAILMVEWAERWPGLPARRMDVALDFAPDGGRDVTVTTEGAGWDRALRALRALGARRAPGSPG
jgi:tRNA threonylcarbamoyladenosine biosynthesis protein TsaE